MNSKNPMRKKVNKFIQNLNLTRTLALTWEVSGIWTIITLIFLLLENIAWMGTIYVIKMLVDIISAPGVHAESKDLLNTLLLSGGISILYACIKSFSGFFVEMQASRVNQYVDLKIHSHTVKLDLEYYENPEYLDILKRAKEAGIDKPYAVINSLLDIIKNVIMLSTVGYLLVAIDWVLLPLLAFFVLPILIVRVRFSNKNYNLYRKNTPIERETYYLSYLITGDNSAKEIRTFGLGDYLLSKYFSLKSNLISQQITLSKKRTIIELITTLFATTAFFAVTTYIIYGTLRGETSVGDIAIFLVIFPQSFNIMQSIVGAISRLYHNNIYVANIFELFDLEPTIDKPLSTNVPKTTSENTDIVLHNVSFKYPHSTESSLENVSLSIPKGKIIALVGLNGAGKSTLIKLLCRLYDPISGEIKLGNTDIRNIDAKEYRKQISVVFQDFVKYNISVKENILFGNIEEKADMEKIIAAAKNAGATDFIQKFENKYNTLLGRVFDEGHEISVGQWQKIAIARAFYGDSKLIILDEATSALDAIAEADLFHSFRSHIGSRSALVISHRISTIRQADYIYVMSDKSIREAGTHDELIKLDGLYAALYKNNQEPVILP